MTTPPKPPAVTQGPIEFERDGKCWRLLSWPLEAGGETDYGGERETDSADLVAAGYVPAQHQADRVAELEHLEKEARALASIHSRTIEIQRQQLADRDARLEVAASLVREQVSTAAQILEIEAAARELAQMVVENGYESALRRAAERILHMTREAPPVQAANPEPSPPEQAGGERAWLIERTTAAGPVWAKCNTDGHLLAWVSSADMATRFAEKDWAEDGIPLVLDDDEDYPCPAVKVTEHMWLEPWQNRRCPKCGFIGTQDEPHDCEPTPAKRDGGYGPADALRAEIVETFRWAAEAAKNPWWNTLADKLERKGGERR